jgi:hypothetical protein
MKKKGKDKYEILVSRSLLTCTSGRCGRRDGRRRRCAARHDRRRGRRADGGVADAERDHGGSREGLKRGVRF